LSSQGTSETVGLADSNSVISEVSEFLPDPKSESGATTQAVFFFFFQNKKSSIFFYFYFKISIFY
jgi:hypothetical protein